MSWGHWGGYPPSRPKKAKGGIKAQSQRGAFGESWWAKRWIRVLESFNIGARLTRGRSYARSGQVLSIEVGKGVVRATVQGSRPTPYAVTIRVKPIADEDWGKLAKALSGQALFAAKLLAGEMPQNIEQVFDQVKLSLFPARLGDLETGCSCPDWSNPCKHIAAVYYLLGEEFDRDPFLIFTLRGRTRDELLAHLGKTASPSGKVRRPKAAPEAAEAEAASAPAEPLAADPGSFWEGSPGEEPCAAVAPPPIAAGLPKRLGSFPFWRGATPFLSALEPIYTAASPRGLDVFLGQPPGGASRSD